MSQPTLWPDDTARVRRTDPETSHAAADLNDTAGSRRAVLLILQACGPLADFQLKSIHDDIGGRYTEQRLRTARAELVDEGRVTHDTEVIGPKDAACWTWRLRNPDEPEAPAEKRPRARRPHTSEGTMP